MKYTVIYSETFQTGSHRNQITKYKYIECEEDKLTETIESDNEIGSMGSVWFIFEGWCIPQEDYRQKEKITEREIFNLVYNYDENFGCGNVIGFEDIFQNDKSFFIEKSNESFYIDGATLSYNFFTKNFAINIEKELTLVESVENKELFNKSYKIRVINFDYWVYDDIDKPNLDRIKKWFAENKNLFQV